jgi:hypothetical protein
MFFNEYFVQQKKAAPKKEKENYYLLVQSLNLVQGDSFGTAQLLPRFTAIFPEGFRLPKKHCLRGQWNLP